eukprot:COSAG01_NODE_29785_length_629_cov_15.941509_1_plen_71_part_10
MVTGKNSAENQLKMLSGEGSMQSRSKDRVRCSGECKKTRDNYAFVGAIIIDYQFYRGPVPHSQITPTPIGA